MTNEPLRVGLIGLGAIGTSVAERAEAIDSLHIVAALVSDGSKSRPDNAPTIVATIDELLEERPEVVVEVAGHAGLRAHGPAVLRAGCDLYFVAVGALADADFERELKTAALESGQQARITSGAIGGLDALAGAARGNLQHVTHTVRKPPTTLLDPDRAANLTEALEIFNGSAREGALLYPESVNVAAAVSFAGIGLDRTTLRILADPAMTRNRHEVEASGDFGNLRFEIENIPSASNPRSGSLVAMSVIHQLLQRGPGLIVG